MRRSALVVVSIVLVGCSSDGAAPLASGAPPSLAAAASPSPIPSPAQPIVLSGTNSKVTDPMEIPPGRYRVSWQASYTGAYSENFVVYIQGQSRNLLINEIVPTTNQGEALFSSAGGQFIIEVKASSTSWKFTFTWLSPA